MPRSTTFSMNSRNVCGSSTRVGFSPSPVSTSTNPASRRRWAVLAGSWNRVCASSLSAPVARRCHHSDRAMVQRALFGPPPMREQSSAGAHDANRFGTERGSRPRDFAVLRSHRPDRVSTKWRDRLDQVSARESVHCSRPRATSTCSPSDRPDRAPAGRRRASAGEPADRSRSATSVARERESSSTTNAQRNCGSDSRS